MQSRLPKISLCTKQYKLMGTLLNYEDEHCRVTRYQEFTGLPQNVKSDRPKLFRIQTHLATAPAHHYSSSPGYILRRPHLLLPLLAKHQHQGPSYRYFIPAFLDRQYSTNAFYQDHPNPVEGTLILDSSALPTHTNPPPHNFFPGLHISNLTAASPTTRCTHARPLQIHWNPSHDPLSLPCVTPESLHFNLLFVFNFAQQNCSALFTPGTSYILNPHNTCRLFVLGNGPGCRTF